MNVEEILDLLTKASKDLSNFPYDRILNAINSITISDLFGVRVPKGQVVLRARPSKGKDFSNIEEVSYPKSTIAFGRANRPSNPMFYGAITSKPEENYLDQLVLLFLELLELKRTNITSEGEKKLTVGRWFNDEDLFVFVMIFHEEYLKKNSHLIEGFHNYLDIIKQSSNNISQLQILKFIAADFAKSNINSDNDYKISAAFVESMLKKSLIKIDGIIYPSVRCEGEYFNIALTPECVDSKMSLHEVVTTTVYYKNKVVINDYEKEAFLKPGEKDFYLSDIIDPNYHYGRTRILKALDEEVKKYYEIKKIE
jgi:hypothetical protein